MNNPLAGAFALKIGDLTYTLDFGVNTMCFIETDRQQPALEFMEDFQANPDFLKLRYIVWAGLQRRHKDAAVTLEDAGDILSASTLTDVFSQITAAITGARPTEEEVALAAGGPRKGRQKGRPTRKRGVPSGST